jgi:hypothetical protein
MRDSVLGVLFRSDDLRESEVEVGVSIDCFTLPASLLLERNPVDCFEVARVPAMIAATGCNLDMVVVLSGVVALNVCEKEYALVVWVPG